MNTPFLLHPANWGFLDLIHFFGMKVLLAFVCGGMVGLERELKNKPAGLKTNILICLGSAIYTAVSILISNANGAEGHFGDPGRVAAQIVSGIGFLGGGVIIQARGTVVGLTTAATIWVVSALGVAIGLGYHDVAVVLALMVVIILLGVSWFEDRVLGRSITFHSEILVDDLGGETRHAINALLVQHDLVLESFDIAARGENQSAMTIRYSGHRADQKKFNLALWGTHGVKEIRQN